MMVQWNKDQGEGREKTEGSYFALLVLSSVGGCPDRNLSLDREPMRGRVEARCRGVGKREEGSTASDFLGP